jgi:hypothetical protein
MGETKYKLFVYFHNGFYYKLKGGLIGDETNNKSGRDDNGNGQDRQAIHQVYD